MAKEEKKVKNKDTATDKAVKKSKQKDDAKKSSKTEKLAKAKAKGDGVTKGKVKKAAKAGKAKKRKGFFWTAPTDHKNHFLEIVARTDKDGLFGNDLRATRYTGRYDPNADDKKKADLATYDGKTLIGIMSRLAAVSFKTNPNNFYPEDVKERNKTEKVDDKVKLVYRKGMRLPPNTVFKILLRIGKRSADNTLTVAVKFVQQAVKKDGRVKGVELGKKDPAYRLIAKAKRFLPAAFKDNLLPPKRGRGGKIIKEADED